jgi:hypothetical protein
LQDLPKFTQIGIFGFKIYHLATLVESGDVNGAEINDFGPGSEKNNFQDDSVSARCQLSGSPGLPDGLFLNQKSQLG